MEVVCTICGAKRIFDPMRWRCDCGGPFDLDYFGSLDRKSLAGKPLNFWRYRDALPLPADAQIVSLGEPITPLVPLDPTKNELLLKLDYLMPTGSYKDRGSAVMMTDLAARGVKKIVEDSSGNAGASVAAYSVRSGIEAEIYVPAATSPGKTAQISAYGASLFRVDGDRQATADAVHIAAEKTCYASHVWNPMFMQGTKTAAYEIAEQLGWQAPEEIFFAVGNGALLLGVYHGFSELLAAGLVSYMPRLIAVQSENCMPIAAAWSSTNANYTQTTIAEGIAINKPARKNQLFSTVKKTSGEVIAVSEVEISRAVQMLARNGWFVEPTGAVAFAGARKRKKNAKNGPTIAFVTGNGLKSRTSVMNLLSRDY